MLSNQNPSLLYRMIDTWGNNCLFSFIYSSYIGRLGLSGDEAVLDFGSGSGAGSRHLAKVLAKGNGRLTCVDISDFWMKVAKQRLRKFRNVAFLTGQLTELRLPEQSFDAVFIHYCLHEIPEKLRQPICGEFFRLLKAGGRLYIKEPKRQGDGISAKEIRDLMLGGGLKEVSSSDQKKTFQAVFVRADL